MRLFQSFNSEYLQVKFNVLVLLICLFCESVSQPLYKNEPKIEICKLFFIKRSTPIHSSWQVCNAKHERKRIQRSTYIRRKQRIESHIWDYWTRFSSIISLIIVSYNECRHSSLIPTCLRNRYWTFILSTHHTKLNCTL